MGADTISDDFAERESGFEGTCGGSTKATPAHAIEAALSAARSYQGSEEFAKAEAVLRAAVGEHVDDQALRLAYAEVLLSLRRPEEAYEQYEAALAIGPQEAAIEFQAGTLASSIGKNDRALEHFSMARAAEPRSAEIALYLGVTQFRLGMIEEAKVSLLSAVKLDENEPVAPAMLAQIALDENQPEIRSSWRTGFWRRGSFGDSTSPRKR